MDVITWLIEPISFAFMQRGLAAGVLAGIACAVLSAFVVWRGMAFVGDAMAHTILPGVVIAFLRGANLFVGALIAAILTALGIGWFSRDREVREDTAIGVMFSGFFALGILLLSRVRSYQDLTHILFGDILGVSSTDLWIIAGVTVLVIAAVVLFYKELLVTSFDPGHAVAIGLSPELVRYGLLILLALTVVAAIQAVGVVMVIALLVTPAATASLLARQLPRIMLLGAVFAVISAVVGLYASYYANVASGAAIVLTLTVLFLLAFLFAPRRGLVWRAVRGEA
ncbi:MAG TPA: metal ABC transporter permease [Aggregatilineales bacterium]|jgi:ABC-type Mn2+/Zn2+ transport system permease subunit|nr:metal ABC transporter permease [Aggregatilineales bacterium]HPV07009.1 metal ABC transporter permease [Aggregatilineales bacterium]HQA68733.1 metal ABC transporter permease [Aggregatilineales bacterium]HQE19469.1 metal ABC transporter permease [Aggregatilineales bacterium]